MEVTLLGITMEVNLLQPVKALLPINVRLFGSKMEVSGAEENIE